MIMKMKPLGEQTAINLSKEGAKKLIKEVSEVPSMYLSNAREIVYIIDDYQRLAEQTRDKRLSKVI